MKPKGERRKIEEAHCYNFGFSEKAAFLVILTD